MQAGMLLNAMSLRRPADTTVPVKVCITCECMKNFYSDTTYDRINREEVESLQWRVHQHGTSHISHRGNRPSWETVKTWPTTCWTQDCETEYEMPPLDPRRTQLRHLSLGPPLRNRSRSPHRGSVSRDTASGSSDPNGLE